MNKDSLEDLKLRYIELDNLRQKDLTSIEVQEEIRWAISTVAGIAADWNEKGYAEYLRDVSDYFGRWGIYSASQEVYKQKLAELCTELEDKIQNMKANLPYG
ncbi:MAG: hypothetical protein J0L77_00370 [Alphaproteobacteria bacterium]|nr:hypothetical protein [Alphaproteobacteria bacterium]